MHETAQQGPQKDAAQPLAGPSVRFLAIQAGIVILPLAFSSGFAYNPPIHFYGVVQAMNEILLTVFVMLLFLVGVTTQ